MSKDKEKKKSRYKLDFAQKIMSAEGHIYQETDPDPEGPRNDEGNLTRQRDMTLGSVAIACLNNVEADQNKDLAYKHANGALACKIGNLKGMIEIDIDEAKLIKDHIGLYAQPIVKFRCDEMLEGKEESPTDDDSDKTPGGPAGAKKD